MNKMRVVIHTGQGRSWNQIHKQTGIACSTARSICSKMQQCGSVKNELFCGTPPKLSTRDVRKLKKEL